MRTLLIDDSLTMRAIQRGILTQLGHPDVDEAETAEQALALLGEFDPDLILVDRALPDMDGAALVRAIHARSPSARVIVVAADAHREAVVDAINAGAASYVAKPFTPDVLCQCITEVLARSGDD